MHGGRLEWQHDASIVENPSAALVLERQERGTNCPVNRSDAKPDTRRTVCEGIMIRRLIAWLRPKPATPRPTVHEKGWHTRRQARAAWVQEHCQRIRETM
jgi:hypothetical protein